VWCNSSADRRSWCRRSGLLVDDLETRRRLQSTYFTGVDFEFSVDFSRFWSISNIFGGRFSLFLSFFNFQVRYTRTEEVTLYYCSSENCFKAGQLGPRAYRISQFCPACGFRILCKACFTKMVFEYSQQLLVGLVVLTSQEVLA
jgi:hypothetical protein